MHDEATQAIDQRTRESDALILLRAGYRAALL